MGNPAPYDVKINNRGYLLARREQLGSGGRAWQVTSQGASIARQTDSESRFGNQPATVELPVVWESAHLGFGDDRQRAEGRYHYAVDVDARFPEMVIPGPYVTTVATSLSENVTAFAEIGGLLLFLAGRYVKEFKTGGTIGSEHDLGAGVAGVSMAVYNSYLYVGEGFTAANHIHKRDNAGTTAGNWSQDDDVHAGYLLTLKDRLYAQSSTRGVKWVTGDEDPFDATLWSSEYLVGDSTSAITGLAGLGEQLYIAKTDGLYAMDQDGIVGELAPELRAYVAATTGLNLRAWHGSIWMPHLRGLLEYRSLGDAGHLIRSVGPARDSLSDNPIRGRITAMAGDDRWLYAALYTGTDTYILAGREARTQEEEAFGRLLWHPIAKVASVQCQAMHISGLWTNPRLFFGTGVNVSYITLPRYMDNPLSDSNCFVEETPVWSPHHVLGASRRPYRGELVKLTTASGKQLTGTPNHPILTDTGWKPLGLLVEGDNVIRCCFGEEVQLGELDVDHVNTPIKEIFNLADVSGPAGYIASDKEFDRDRQDGDIQVVRPVGVLENRREAPFEQPTRQEGFAPSSLAHGALLSQCALVQFLRRGVTAPTCAMSCLCERCPLFRCPSPQPKVVGLAIGAQTDASAGQTTANHWRRNTQRLSDSDGRFLALDIAPDNVVHVERVDFAGHVYNLQTASEWYIANSIIAHNCQFATSGRFYYSAHDSKVPATTKLYKSLRVELEGSDVDASTYVNVFYRVDRGDWSFAGRCNTEGVTTLELDPYGVSGKSIEVRVNHVLNANTESLRVRRIVALGAERPELVDVIQVVVRCADHLALNDGSHDSRTGAEILAELWALPALSQSVPLVDIVGTERQVLVQAPIDERETEKQAGSSREVLATVRMSVFSTEETASAWTTVNFNVAASTTEMDIPLAVPWNVGGSAVGLYQTVSYSGTAPTSPKIKVTGPITAFTITNDTTSEDLTFTGITIAAGDYYLIDMHRNTKVVVDSAGNDKSGDLAAGSDLNTFHLNPGDNAFHVTGTTISSATRVVMEYIQKET